MQTEIDELKKLEEKHQQEIQKIKAEHNFRRLLPEAYREKASIFVHEPRQYSPEVAWITLKLEVSEVVDALRALPAGIPAAKTSGTFTSFAPLFCFDNLTDEEYQKFKQLDEILPYWVEIEPNFSPRLEIKFHAYLGGQVVEFHVESPLHSWGRRAAWITGRRNEYRGGFSYENCSIEVASDFYTIRDESEQSIYDCHRFLWARGSHEYLNNGVVYWTNNDGEKRTNEEQKDLFLRHIATTASPVKGS